MLNQTPRGKVVIGSRKSHHQSLLITTSTSVMAMLSVLSYGTTRAAEVSEPAQLDKVVVTAQKRSQDLRMFRHPLRRWERSSCRRRGSRV